MPTLTEIREQRKALEKQYGQLPTVRVGDHLSAPALSPSSPTACSRPPAEIVDGNAVRLTDAQVAALAAAGIKDGTNWWHQLDQAIGLYTSMREDMPQEEWGDMDLPPEMRSELLRGA